MFEGDRLLRIPGPTPVPDRIVRAMSRPMMGHRSSEFADVYKRVTQELKELFHTDGDVFVFAGSGTLAMESAVANLLLPGEQAVIASGGKFGERWVELARAYGAEPVVLEYPYGTGIEPERLSAALKAHPEARVVFATHNESSTAVTNDIEALAKITREYDRILVVDAVSSFGGVPLPMDRWGVDVVCTGSQKCLMLPPGLAFVAVGERAWEKARSGGGARYYVDWSRYQKSAPKGQTPYTPAVSMVFGLEESVNMLREEGEEARFQRHRLMRDMVRRGLEALDFELFVEERWASPTVTAAASGHTDVEELRKTVQSLTRVVLSGGQGELKGRIFRIGHMGAASPLDMVTTIGAIEIALAKMGRPQAMGAGTGRALEVWHEWQ